ncbi:class I poly(R)-hydroxyalkanoic acid synthase, partial [bacterium LRH843]|nr:class I poly(R)-hydroxyalkanoic acid synthase [bacterium LRH843]
RCATFLTTLVDFSDSGDLKLFVDEDQIGRIEKHMERTGFLDGREMAAIFNVIRANDLIWSFVINHYLMGKEPFPFDILYWNSDPTSLPAATHS